MKSKFKLYDKVKDYISEYEGSITAIHLKAEGFIYTICSISSGGALPVTGDFPEARLELIPTEQNRIGFYLETGDLT